MDIIVTTPRSEIANAAREAADCIAAGGGEYFRRFPVSCYPVALKPGDRVYYVEDGFVRGFALADRIQAHYEAQRCDTSGRQWAPGIYVFMRADSWQWIRPIPMRGFQGFRYAETARVRDRRQTLEYLVLGGLPPPGSTFKAPLVQARGGWRDPRPEVAP